MAIPAILFLLMMSGYRGEYFEIRFSFFSRRSLGDHFLKNNFEF